MIINKSEKTISVKGHQTKKGFVKQHRRKIKFDGKQKDSIQFKELNVTGLPEMDLKISHCIHEFDKKVADGKDMREAVKSMVDSQTKMEYTKIGIDDPKTDIIMNNLSKIVGDSNKGLTDDLVINIIESGRSNYAPQNNTINISNAKNLSERIYHEYGHHLEASKRSIHRACVKFHDNRTVNEPEIKLDDLIPGIGYGDEITKKDKFIHPYVGRIYDPYMSSTEILSYGGEQFTNSVSMESFYKKDREHFALCLAAISGRI